jgi:hypothetical protein
MLAGAPGFEPGNGGIKIRSSHFITSLNLLHYLFETPIFAMSHVATDYSMFSMVAIYSRLVHATHMQHTMLPIPGCCFFVRGGYK